jgi:hypothetical protein
MATEKKRRYPAAETYEAVEALREEKGLGTVAAFKVVAKARGCKSHDGVQSAYYKHARALADGTPVRKPGRPKKTTTTPARSAKAQSASSLVREARDVIARLEKELVRLENEAAELRHKAGEYDRLAANFKK